MTNIRLDYDAGETCSSVYMCVCVFIACMFQQEKVILRLDDGGIKHLIIYPVALEPTVRYEVYKMNGYIEWASPIMWMCACVCVSYLIKGKKDLFFRALFILMGISSDSLSSSLRHFRGEIWLCSALRVKSRKKRNTNRIMYHKKNLFSNFWNIHIFFYPINGCKMIFGNDNSLSPPVEYMLMMMLSHFIQNSWAAKKFFFQPKKNSN